MSYVFKELGYNVLHESGNSRLNPVGTVAPRLFNRLPYGGFHPVLHQTRHPLKVIASLQGIRKGHPMGFVHKNLYYLHLHPEYFKFNNWVDACAFWWLINNKFIERFAQFRYKIEDFDKVYPKVFHRCGLPVPDKLPDVPKDTNTGKHHRIHQKGMDDLTWNKLAEMSPRYHRHVKALAEEYGYED